MASGDNASDNSSAAGSGKAGTMSFVFHLSSILPQPATTDPLTLHLYGTFNPQLRAIVPYKLGRIFPVPSLREEYLAFIGQAPAKPNRNIVLPSIRRTLRFSESQVERRSRFNHYNQHKQTLWAPGVVRIWPGSGRTSPTPRGTQALTPMRDRKTYQVTLHKRFHTYTDPAAYLPFKPKPPTVIASYEGDLTNGVKNGFGIAFYTNGDKYKGEWAEDKRHGTGTHRYRELGAKYKGDWVMEKRNGEGILVLHGHTIQGKWEDDRLQTNRIKVVYAGGQQYEGDFVDGLREGAGTLLYSERSGHYLGPWVNNVRDGLGVLESNEYLFEGQFIHDTTEGQGALVYKQAIKDVCSPGTGSKEVPPDFSIQEQVSTLTSLEQFNKYQFTANDIIYIPLNLSDFQAKAEPPADLRIEAGHFTAGKLNGAGIAIYGSFGTYVGNFTEGKRCGWGKMSYSDPNYICIWTQEAEGEFVGQWCNDQRQGIGTMVWPNNMQYHGYFNGDKRDQVSGTMTFMTGEVYDGGWVNNMIHGYGTLKATSGVVFKGQFVQGRAEKDGILLFPDGRKFEGSVSMFEPHGEGKMQFPNGDFYTGSFKRGVFAGKGHMKYHNGHSYQGNWEKGMKHGQGEEKTPANTYVGEWKNNERDGRGVLRNKARTVLFDGEWSKGKRVS